MPARHTLEVKAAGDDLETIPVVEGGPAPGLEPEQPSGDRWPVPVLVACAVVSTVALVTIAVMEWRQADAARQEACFNRAVNMAQLESPFGDPGEDQRRRVAACYGLDVDGSVPNVVGLRVGDARRRLQDAGFVPEINEGDRSRFDDVVSAQEPGPGVEVPPGSVVGLRTRSPRRS